MVLYTQFVEKIRITRTKVILFLFVIGKLKIFYLDCSLDDFIEMIDAKLMSKDQIKKYCANKKEDIG